LGFLYQRFSSFLCDEAYQFRGFVQVGLQEVISARGIDSGRITG